MGGLSATVWMVSGLTGPDGLRGRLTLEGHRLVFTPERGDPPTQIHLDRVKRAKRIVGSPVLEVGLRSGSPSLMGFYFVEPPSLEIPAEGRKFMARRRVRRTAVAQLVGANSSKKEEIKVWVRAIRQAASGPIRGKG